MDAPGWASTFTNLEQEWRSVAGRGRREPSLEDWTRLFGQFEFGQRSLKARGLWVSGYSDLMHVGRVADDELTHSNMVAWFLNPAGRHGFGDSLLRAILEEGWVGSGEVRTEGALVRREVTEGTRRADVVVYMGPTTLVIENKVGSKESPWQCEDLYQLWFEPEADVRFLLLTPKGQTPREVKTQAAVDAWRRLSYPSLAGWLNDKLNEKPDEDLPRSSRSLAQRTLARMTVQQYIATIRESYGIGPFSVGVGGGSVRERE